MLKKTIFFLSLNLVILAISCSPEKRLAKKFIASNDSVKILLLKTDYLYKKNLKINSDSLPESIIDSVSLAQSELLKNIDSKVFLNILYSGLIDEMKKYKLKVYTEDSLTSFMRINSGSAIFNLTQVELDEYNIPFTASQQFDTTIYTQDFALTAASANVWLEVTKQNEDVEKNRILFSSQYISDNIDGYFRKTFLTNEIKYYYNRSNINADDVYSMAADFAMDNAGYIYDYFLNEYVYSKYKGRKKLVFMHFDRQSHKVIPAGYNRFIFM